MLYIGIYYTGICIYNKTYYLQHKYGQYWMDTNAYDNNKNIYSQLYNTRRAPSTAIFTIDVTTESCQTLCLSYLFGIDKYYCMMQWMQASLALDGISTWWMNLTIWSPFKCKFPVLGIKIPNVVIRRSSDTIITNCELLLYISEVSLKFVPNGIINKTPALVQIMTWRQPGDMPLSEPMVVTLPTHICVTRPQWVNLDWVNKHECVMKKYSWQKPICKWTTKITEDFLYWSVVTIHNCWNCFHMLICVTSPIVNRVLLLTSCTWD